MSTLFLFLSLIANTEASFPKPEWMTGRLGVQQFSSRSESLQTSAYGWLKTDPHLIPGSDILVLRSSLLGRSFYNSIERKQNWNVDSDIRELFLQINASAGFEIRLGKIITSWGKTDIVNPTDYLTARDYTFLSEDTELKRLGGVGIEIRFTPEGGVSPWQFTGVFYGYGPRNQQLIPSTFAVPGVSFQREPTDSRFTRENFEWAAKVVYIKENWDFSLNAFRGRDRFTDFVFVPSKLTIEQWNPKITAFGADASVGLQKYILRFESAVYRSEFGSRGAQGAALTEPSHWDSVFGIERAIGDDFRVIAQGLYRYHWNWTTPVNSVARFNAILKNYQRKSRPAASLSVVYEKSDSDWGGDFSVIGNFLGGDTIWRQKFSYKPTDDFKIFAGTEIYSGSRSETFGILKDFSSVFLEGQWFF